MSARPLSTVTAASRSGSLASGDDSSAAALACSMRCLTPGSASLARARSSAGSAAGSCDLNTASAAASRIVRSDENRRRLPNAASMAPRTALFMRTGLRPLAITSGAAAPVAASARAAVVLFDEQRLVRAHEQSPGLQRGDDRRRPRLAGQGEHLDAVAHAVEAGRRQRGQRFVGRLRVAPAPAPATAQPSTADRQDVSLADFRASHLGWPGEETGHPSMAFDGSGHQAFLPPPAPHLPVLTLNAPHDSGARQSPIRSLVSST